MKLVYKIALCVAVSTLLVGAGNYYATFFVLKNLQGERIQTSEGIAARVLAKSIYRSIVEEKAYQVTDDLFDAKNDREEKVAYYIVFDGKGYLLAHTFIGDIPKLFLSLNNHFERGEVLHFLNLPAQHVYDLAVPVMEGIKQVGTLHMGLKQGYVDNIITPTRKASDYITRSTLLIVFLSVIFAIFLSQQITKPIGRLKNFAHKVSEGDFTAQIQTRSRDELGELATAFNIMTKQLQRITVSRAEMFQEIEQRKAAEIKIIQSSKELETSRLAALNMMQDAKEARVRAEATTEDLQREIVERKKLENQLLQSQKMETVGTLAGGIAHD